MRTTINLDPEALAVARLLSRQRNVSMGEIISKLILKKSEDGAVRPVRNGVPVFPAVDGTAPGLELVNELRDKDDDLALGR
jgi:hypothetical protein